MTLKAFEMALKAFEMALKAFEMALKAFEMISAIAIVREEVSNAAPATAKRY
jgi:hypothetical protein